MSETQLSNREYIAQNMSLDNDIIAEQRGMHPEAVRAVKRRILGTHTKPKNKTVVTEKSVEEQMADVQLKIAQQQLRKLEGEELQNRARVDLLLKAIVSAVTPLQFVDSGISYVRNGDAIENDVAVMVVTDWHFGKKTPTYNSQIAQQKFAQYCNRLVSECEMRRNAGNDVRVLYMLFGGDMVDGHGIYKTQQAHIDANVMNQIFDNAPFIADQIAQLARYFERIEIHSVPGNHGRIDKVIHETANWDTFFMNTLEVASRNITNVHWHISSDWKTIVDIEGRSNWLLYHGHQIKMTLNLPWYGITTRIARWASTMKLQHFDVAVQGHFHTLSSMYWNAKRIFTNGTAVENDDFALEFLGLESACAQWLVFVNTEGSISSEVAVDLTHHA